MGRQRTYAGISLRSVVIGLFCATAECLIAPYNDYVIRNVFLAGGQEVGACLTFVLFTFWKARHHIKNMFKSTFNKSSEISNGSNEAMPYSLIISGLIGGIFLLAFLNHLMGMSGLYKFPGEQAQK